MLCARPSLPCYVFSLRRIVGTLFGAGIAFGFLITWAVATRDPGPLSGRFIAIDAGHGGVDRGVCHDPTGLQEKDVNLDMARRLASVMQAAGARTLLIREDDRKVPLDERPRIANEAGTDLFISLHVNRIPGHPECKGPQVFYHPGSEEARRLALAIQEALLAVDPENHRQAMPGDYLVLRESAMPAVIVEIGFMTNARDRAWLLENTFRNRVAGAIVDGVVAYFAAQERQDAPPAVR